MSTIRTRFAPSPTGYLHIGGLRTALFAYLTAKSQGGTVALRIEDTDQKREVPGAVDKLITILDWVGLKFDEGPHVGGEYGPYIQSQRLHLYKKHAEELVAKGQAYRCFCSPERLAKMREEQQARKEAPRYDRACRELDTEESMRRALASESHVIRQKMPLSAEVVAHDELRGDIIFKTGELDDHVLLKADGFPTYQLAVVVDDHLMDITHVIRGEEWIPSFPKNLLLYHAFGWAPPKFIHMPLSLNPGGGKLSKRQGDVAVEDYREKGYLPKALLNFSVLQGWHPKGDSEVMSLDEMAKSFKIEEMGKSPAVFDTGKLDYFNGYYIRQLAADELLSYCTPYLEKYWSDRGVVLSDRANDPSYRIRAIKLEQERLTVLSEIGEMTEFFFAQDIEYDQSLLIWKNLSKEEIKTHLEETLKVLELIPENNWTDDSIQDAMFSHIQAKDAKNGDYLWPMRVALTGRKASPGPFEVAEVLGKEETLKRVLNAIKL